MNAEVAPGPRELMQVSAPAEELARALMAVVHIADAKDESATHDTVRLEVGETGGVVVTARNPQMMAGVVVQEAEAIAPGAVEVTPATARELAKICRQKVSADNPVDALLVERADALEMELVYGLPICTHRTRRPVLSWRQKPGHVLGAIHDVSAETEELRDAVMAAADGYGAGDVGAGDLAGPVMMTSTQASALMKASAVLGAEIALHATGFDGRFLARCDGFAAVWVCRTDADDVAGAADGDEPDAGEDAPAPGLRLVGARPIGGVS